jgi:DNA-binding MarR family transcriptional regulator
MRPDLLPLIAAAAERQGELLLPHLRALGLKEGTFQFLLAVSEAKGAPLSEIGRRLGLAPATVSEGLDELVGLGLAERLTTPHDRRQRTATLTMKGLETMGRISAALAQAEQELSAPLSEQEHLRLAELLVKITQRSD